MYLIVTKNVFLPYKFKFQTVLSNASDRPMQRAKQMVQYLRMVLWRYHDMKPIRNSTFHRHQRFSKTLCNGSKEPKYKTNQKCITFHVTNDGSTDVGPITPPSKRTLHARIPQWYVYCFWVNWLSAYSSPKEDFYKTITHGSVQGTCQLGLMDVHPGVNAIDPTNVNLTFRSNS